MDQVLVEGSCGETIELLQRDRSIAEGPAIDGRVIDGDASLGYHLLEISHALTIGEVPLYAEQNHGSVRMSVLEHLFIRH